MSRLAHLKQFYCLLSTLEEQLAGARRLSECSGRMPWPKRGIYFFRELGEDRTDSGTGPRIVRVGTHALKAGAKTKLWNRLSQHRGSMRTGGGNHRGSIFRLIIGSSLIEREGIDCPTWDTVRNSAPREVREREQAMEERVSAEIRAMPFLWLAIEDEPGPCSLRGYIERNAIALLSNYDKEDIDPASGSWLGRHCNRKKVQDSGLWNSNHVEEGYDPRFLDMLEDLIEKGEEPK